MLLNITQGTIDDDAGGAQVFCAKGHQAAITGINMRRWLGDEHDGVPRNLVNLEPDVSEYLHAHTVQGGAIWPQH